MDLQLSISGNRSVTREAYAQLRERILDGRLGPGERLPASRELAAQLSIARKTVTNVYDLLIGEGFLETRPGAGTFVAEGVSKQKDIGANATSPVEVLPQWCENSSLILPKTADLPFNFEVGVPDISRFPFALWRSIINSRARLLSRNAEMYADPQGHRPLREAIAKYTGFTRAVVCSAESVTVTNGAQQAFSLISDILLRPGAVVAMEDPGYSQAHRLFESRGAKIAGVPVDEEGLVVDKLPAHAKLVYVTPSHQFPLGVCMSLRRRLALLEWAVKRKAAIVEDDYDSEFRFAPRPLDSLQSLDRYGVVLYVGTFSKVLFPGLRVGFVVAPEPVRGALVAARQLMDWHGSTLIESALTRFINHGHLALYIRHMRRVYAERRRTLIDSLENEMGDEIRIWAGKAGLHLAMSIRKNVSPDMIAAKAMSGGVCLMPFGDRGIAMGYGAIAEEKIPEGVARLANIIRIS